MGVNTKRLSEKQKWIVAYLFDKGWTGLGEIGMATPYSDAEYYGTPWASPKCKSLVKRGLIERKRGGKYRLTEDGRKFAEESL